MADSRQGGESIRDLIAGFNGMQQQLGLLPVSSGQQPMGVQLNQPPPPPPIMHPSEMAMQVSAQQQAMMMQTMQAAQMTRYQPPPSSPALGGGGAMFNPQMAAAMGGGGMGGGGLGIPNPMYSTAPAFGMYRPGGGGGPGMGSMMGIRPPSIFNPLAPQLPAPMFSTQPQQNYQIMQARQAEAVGTLAGIGEFGAGMGGSMLGGALGLAAFGPLGGFAGSMIGGMAGSALGGMAMNAPLMDIQRGRGIQNMTSSFMAGGASLNPFTGMGMERGAATQTARGLRQFGQNYDFQRQTGFNTEDVMKLTQLAGDQGLLQTAQNPEDIVNKMKQVSKSISALVKITGDPDVKNAMAHLGQMRQLGFEGLSGQTGAVASRARFAQMAGVSQGAMHDQYGMPGAYMAQNMGLAGATGYSAGMIGGTTANQAISSRSFTDVQLNLAGGKQGVAQTITNAMLRAVDRDVYVAAATRGGDGEDLTVDKDAFLSAVRAGPAKAAEMMSESLGKLSPAQRTSYKRQSAALKAQLVQQMRPDEFEIAGLEQAMSMDEAAGSQIGFGGGLEAVFGDAAETVRLTYKNPDTWKAKIQQAKVTDRERRAMQRGKLGEIQTGGLFTRMGRGISGGLTEAGEAISEPFAGAADRWQQGAEDVSLEPSGDIAIRREGSAVLRNERDRASAAAAMLRSGPSSGRDLIGTGSVIDNSRSMNRVQHLLCSRGLSSANKAAELGSFMGGGLFGPTTYGDPEEGRRLGKSAEQMAAQLARGTGFTTEQAESATKDLKTALGVNASGMEMFHQDVTNKLKQKASTWGGLGNNKPITMEMMREAIKETAKQHGKEGRLSESDIDNMAAMQARRAGLSGDDELKDAFARSKEGALRSAAIMGAEGMTAIKERVEATETALGFRQGGNDKDVEALRNLARDFTPDEMALATADVVAGDEESLGVNKERAKALRASLAAKYEGKTGKDGFEALSERAAMARDKLKGRGVKSVLGNVLGAGGAEGVQGAFEQLRQGTYDIAGGSALEEVAAQLSRTEGMPDVTGKDLKSMMDAIAGQEGAIDKVSDPALKAAIQARKLAQTPEEREAAAVKGAAAVAAMGGQSTTAIIGTESAEGKADIARLKQAQERFGKGQGGRQGADYLFSSSVQVFKDAVMTLAKRADERHAGAAAEPVREPGSKPASGSRNLPATGVGGWLAKHIPG